MDISALANSFTTNNFICLLPFIHGRHGHSQHYLEVNAGGIVLYHRDYLVQTS